jgi:putative acetyltransferase
MISLRVLQPADLDQLIEVYRDAVISQAVGLYTPSQIAAWSEHAARSNVLRDSLRDGHGVASCPLDDPTRIEAFGILDPRDRLALLYCRGNACRQGRASAILDHLTDHARRQGVKQLRTEASQLSRPLLLRRGWSLEAEETVRLGNASFLRWRMIRPLQPRPMPAASPCG